MTSIAQPLPDLPDTGADTPQSAADAVFHGIVQGLAQQRFVPGQRLVEVDLAAQFGVSRNSVREALQRLAAQGLVDLFRNKGAAIRTLSPQETLEVLDVAERMTGLLARSAARGIAHGAPTAPIQAALAQLHEADRSQDADAFASARRGMYRALLAASGSRELRRLLPSIHMPIVYAQHRPATLQQVRMRDYQAMCDAVLAGDAAAADAAGMQHVRNVREAIARRLGAVGLAAD
ncbi:MAG: GntR family transcriptional regulator [Diaphorobacter nitroreducens]|uniref:GntR family transcriptional regulator n=1 Tax=Diaphorobacter nitroreducens TaxID=164759 RepID=UPI003C72FFD0